MHSSPRSIATFPGRALLAALTSTTGWAFVAPWPPAHASTLGPMGVATGAAGDVYFSSDASRVTVLD